MQDSQIDNPGTSSAPQASSAPGASSSLGASSDAPNTVRQALQRLAEIENTPLESRPDAFHEIHEHLRTALSEIDDA